MLNFLQYQNEAAGITQVAYPMPFRQHTMARAGKKGPTGRRDYTEAYTQTYFECFRGGESNNYSISGNY